MSGVIASIDALLISLGSPDLKSNQSTVDILFVGMDIGGTKCLLIKESEKNKKQEFKRFLTGPK